MRRRALLAASAAQGGGFGDPFTFYISIDVIYADTFDAYQALDGMTWGDWIHSAYNTDGYAEYHGRIVGKDGFHVTNDRGSSITIDDIIVSGAKYYKG